MKADTQCNDFIGTAAADISDHFKLKDFLITRKVDTDRFEAVGASFYHGYSDFFSASIVCIDKNKSTQETPYLVNLEFERPFLRRSFSIYLNDSMS